MTEADLAGTYRLPIIYLEDFARSLTEARQRAIELHQRLVADQVKLTNRLTASLDAIERSRKILAGRKARLGVPHVPFSAHV